MRMRRLASLIAYAALFGLLLQVLPSYAGTFGKETYEKCVLNNLKGVNDRHVIQAVRDACKRKTTPKRCRYIFDKSLDDYSDPEHQYSSPPPVSSKFQNPYDEDVSTKDYYGTSKRTTDAIARKDLDLHKCIEECEKANMYERHFGECATD